MSNIFGVTSGDSPETLLTNGYQLYDWVVRMNQFPAFWGRGILGNQAVSREEIEFLHKKNCKVVLIHNDLTEAAVSTNDGYQEAIRAVETAGELGAPKDNGIALFAEFGSDWSLHHNWMMSYAQAVTDNGYIPGFIGNTDSSLNFNFDRQYSHYINATREMKGYEAVCWATEPKMQGELCAWNPFCPSALQPNEISLWSTGRIRLNQITAEEVYARDAQVLSCMW